MFNSAPLLKECSSISNTMLLIAASEDLREPLLAGSSQVSRLIFHYSERGDDAATSRNNQTAPAGNLMLSLLLVDIVFDFEIVSLVVSLPV